MKKTVTVLICDYDKFYVSGLKYFLKDWFHAQHLNVNFSNHFQQRARADVIFITFNELTFYRMHALRTEMKTTRRNIFILKEEDEIVEENIADGIQALGTWLSRRSNTLSLITHLEKILQNLSSMAAMPRSAPSVISMSHRLTFRETQILRYLARGISHATVARYLQISEKTVSAHKRNIMAKLNFSRTTELNYWLINEGFCAAREPLNYL